MTALLARPGTGVPLTKQLERRLSAIDTFLAARREAEAAASASTGSRELRMDADRKVEVLRRQHQALVQRCDDHLRKVDGPLQSGRRTALIGHRQPWFVEKTCDLLHARGVDVVGRTDVGADLVGWAVAEQPHVVLVEDKLAMQPGVEVVRDLRRFCDRTLIAAVVPYNDAVGLMLDAGAHCVYVRSVPPAQLVDDIVAHMAA